jgi:hypothetical protein
MGDNVWGEEKEWPLSRAVLKNYFLHSNGEILRFAIKLGRSLRRYGDRLGACSVFSQERRERDENSRG